MNPWKEAVIDACVIDCINWHEDDPARTIKELIEWNVRQALDPKVSKEARELVERGRKEAVS